MIYFSIVQFSCLRRFRICANDFKLLTVLVCIFLTVITYIPLKRCFPPQYTEDQMNLIEKFTELNLSFDTFNNLVADQNNRVFQFNRSSPFIFVSSSDRYSGAPLLGKLLNSHRDIECGQDIKAITHLLLMKQKTLSTKKERTRLDLAGVGKQVFEQAIAAFIIEILTRFLQPAVHLCNVDYFAVKDAYYLLSLFPNSRFLLVIRDGRAVAHSKMPSNHTSDFNSTLYEEHLSTWNEQMSALAKGCRSVGRYCLAVYYEYLLLHPISGTRMILSFLGIEFPIYHDRDNSEFFAGMESALLEGSIISVRNKLTRWTECAPKNVFHLRNNTDLLRMLGYLDLGNPPDYQKISQQDLQDYLFMI